MTSKKRFLLGGGGALMPVLVSLLAIDIGAVLDSQAHITTGNIIGFAIRYLVLFIIGGVVAYLHEDETKPFKLFELGIAAPALITSLITAQAVVVSGESHVSARTGGSGFSIIGSAHAEERYSPAGSVVVAGSLFGDVLDGLSGKVYRKTRESDQSSPKDALSAEAEAKARAEAEAKARAEAEAKARAEAEVKARAEAEAKARAEVEAKARAEVEAKARAEMEAKVRAEMEANERKEMIPMSADQRPLLYREHSNTSPDLASLRLKAQAAARHADSMRREAEEARAAADVLEREYQAALSMAKPSGTGTGSRHERQLPPGYQPFPPRYQPLPPEYQQPDPVYEQPPDNHDGTGGRGR